MEEFKLKDYAAVVLLALMLTFLYLFIADYRRTASQTNSLDGALVSNIKITVPKEITAIPQSKVTIMRLYAMEQAFAEKVLSGSTASSDLGGGIVRYSNAKGTVTFRSNSTFEAELLSYAVSTEDFEQQAKRLAEQFGLSLTFLRTYGRTAEFDVLRDGLEVFGQTIRFEFGESKGVQIVGIYAFGMEQVGEVSEFTDRDDALLKALAEIEKNGIICEEITDCQQGWRFNSGEYTPVWKFTTDNENYQPEIKG